MTRARIIITDGESVTQILAIPGETFRDPLIRVAKISDAVCAAEGERGCSSCRCKVIFEKAYKAFSNRAYTLETFSYELCGPLSNLGTRCVGDEFRNEGGCDCVYLVWCESDHCEIYKQEDIVFSPEITYSDLVDLIRRIGKRIHHGHKNEHVEYEVIETKSAWFKYSTPDSDQKRYAYISPEEAKVLSLAFNLTHNIYVNNSQDGDIARARNTFDKIVSSENYTWIEVDYNAMSMIRNVLAPVRRGISTKHIKCDTITSVIEIIDKLLNMFQVKWWDRKYEMPPELRISLDCVKKEACDD